jgi:D-alanine---D-serine ligase
MKKIAVLFGGNSPEYSVSLASATSVIQGIDPLKYEVIMIGLSPSMDWYLYQGKLENVGNNTWLNDQQNCHLLSFSSQGFQLSEKLIKPDVVFPVLHGKYGEDGCVQGLLEVMNLPYVGCHVAASAICMNKWLLHQLAAAIGIESAPTIQLTQYNHNEAEVHQFIQSHGFPIFVKPNEAGSSKGITKVTDPSELPSALREAFTFSSSILLQKAIDGIEIGCGILGNEQLIVGACDAISLVDGFFDFEEKYQLTSAKITVPAPLPSAIEARIKEKAQLLYRSLGLTGLARIDFFVTNHGAIYLNEINTMPGFTSYSRFPTMMAAVGISYEKLLEKLISLAEEGTKNEYTTINQ